MTTAPVRPGPANAGGPNLDWDDLLADIGDRIRAERQARGWPQNALAQRAGLDRATVKRIEAGQATLRGFLMACTALEVDMGYLLSREWRMPVPHPRPLTARQAEVLRVVADGRPLSVAALELGMTPEGLSSVLTGIYRRLGVADVPRGWQRRQAAVRVATSRGFMDAA